MYECQRCGTPTENSENITNSSGQIIYTMHYCDACDKRLTAEVEFESKGKKYNELRLQCPWCNHKYDNYTACGFDEGDTPEVVCESCGRKFDLEVITRRLYSTWRSICEMDEEAEE